MTDQTDSSDHPAAPLMLNALRDLVSDENVFITDQASADTLQELFEEATTPEQRRRFEVAIAALDYGDHEDADVEGTIRPVVDAVLTAGADRMRATVTHDARFAVSPLNAHLYRFGTTLEDYAIERFCSATDCLSFARTGLEHARNGKYEESADQFERAVEVAETDSERVAMLVMAAWGHHWRGADNWALELVRAALESDTSAWSARMVGFAADDEFADLFRRGEFGVRVYLRATIDLPGSSTFDSFVGTPSEGEADTNWSEIGNDPDCLLLPRLLPETSIRLRLKGLLGEFPAIHGYHVSLGTVNLEDTVARSVEQVLFSGPASEGTTERVQFERVD